MRNPEILGNPELFFEQEPKDRRFKLAVAIGAAAMAGSMKPKPAVINLFRVAAIERAAVNDVNRLYDQASTAIDEAFDQADEALAAVQARFAA